MITIQVIFEDGSSYARKSQYHRSEHEALMAAWHEARLAGKAIRIVHVL